MFGEIFAMGANELLILALTFAMVAYLSSFVPSQRRRRALINEHNCKEVRRIPQKNFLGLDVIREIGKQIAENRRLISVQKLYEKYGSTHSVTLFGNKTISTREPENLRTVYSLNFDHYGLEPLRLPAVEPALGRNIFSTDGPYWKHSRDHVNAIFTRGNVSNISAFEKHFEQMLEEIPKDGSAFDMMPLINDLFTNSALDFLFGADTLSQTAEAKAEKDEFVEAFGEVLAGIGRRIRLGKLRWFVRDTKFTSNSKKVHAYGQKYLDLALKEKSAEKSEQYIFLHEMIKQITDQNFIRSNMLGVLVAGHESTGILLSNLMWVTSRRPDVWKRLRQDALAVQDQPITFEFLKSQRYLQHVINETLRLYHILPTSTRLALQDTVLPTGGGDDGKSPILVRKGTSVVHTPNALHRRKDIYGEDAEEFRPERWETLRQNWHYLPFGGGPRICPAQQQALTEASYCMFRLVLLFKENRSCDDRPWTEEIRLTVRNKHGTKIALIPA